jgi:hypothetical protein
MKRWIPIVIVVGILLLASTAVGAGPEVINRNGRISINADNVSLGELLRLWDQATGMQSSAPPELTSQTVTVHFADLNINDAVRAMFNGQPFGYGLMQGRGIVVTAPPPDIPETIPETELQSEFTGIDLNAPETVGPSDIPPVERMKPELAEPTPVVIPTPFGPIISPDGYEPPLLQLPPVPGAPPPPAFFRPELMPPPPAGAANGPAENSLFGPLSIHK